MEYLSSVPVERKLRHREKCVRRDVLFFGSFFFFFFGLSNMDVDMAEWGGQFGYEITPQPGMLKVQIIFGTIVFNLKIVNLGSEILVICISKTHNILFPKKKKQEKD